MNKRNIIKSINETLMELPRRTYFWNRKLPRLKTIDKITSKEILIEVYGLKYPVTRKKGIFYEVFFGYSPWVLQKGYEHISTEDLNRLLSQIK